jgi:NTP pyrophosphatase (non-canonical NTP hydrolase)
MPDSDVQKLRDELRKFAEERDWNQFHSPKNLAMALVVESSEIVEKFQWMTEQQSFQLSPDKLEEVKDEIGDVLNYLVRLSDMLGVCPLDAAIEKLEKNRHKYPIHKSKGNCKKYTEL